MVNPHQRSGLRDSSGGHNLTYGLADRLGGAIVTGRYDNRPFPTEAEVCRLHGVSRPVAREAVKMLAAKGMLGARPREGTFIKPIPLWNLFDADILRWLLQREFSSDLLRHVSQLRIAVEPYACALAARRADDGDIARISAALARMQTAACGDGDPLAADIAFHVAILEASKNPFLAQFRDLVETALRTSIKLTSRIEGRTASIADHAVVFDAIAAGDSAAARRAMHSLIADVVQVIERAQALPA
jgi:DNA-binding FadR family transcriptional regulator